MTQSVYVLSLMFSLEGACDKTSDTNMLLTLLKNLQAWTGAVKYNRAKFNAHLCEEKEGNKAADSDSVVFLL